MPFCSQCGHQVADSDAFCAACGGKQPAKPKADPLSTVSPRTAAILCYVPMIGWIASVVVLAADRFRTDRNVRFHAFQGLYLFVAWLIVDQVIGPFFQFVPRRIFRIDKILELALFCTWIFMLIKTSQNETYSLPIVGELAERSAAER